MIVIDIVPVSAPRMVASDKWKDRVCVTRYFAYRTELQLKLKKFKYELGDNLDIEFILPMPRSWSNKKKKSMMFEAHQVRPDLDNLLKAFMDSFGVEDSFVFKIKASKMWGEKGEIIIY